MFVLPAYDYVEPQWSLVVEIIHTTLYVPTISASNGGGLAQVRPITIATSLILQSDWSISGKLGILYANLQVGQGSQLVNWQLKMASTVGINLEPDEPEDAAFHNETESADRRVIDHEAVRVSSKDEALESADLNKKVLSSWLRVHFLKVRLLFRKLYNTYWFSWWHWLSGSKKLSGTATFWCKKLRTATLKLRTATLRCCRHAWHRVHFVRYSILSRKLYISYEKGRTMTSRASEPSSSW